VGTRYPIQARRVLWGRPRARVSFLRLPTRDYQRASAFCDYRGSAMQPDDRLSVRSARLHAPAGRRIAIRDHHVWIVAAFTLFSLALGLSQIHQSLFGDEIYAYRDVANTSFGGVLAHVNSNLEASPPLYFVLAWLTAKLGDPTVWLRLPSVLLGTATIPVVYMIGRETVGARAGAVAAAIFALNPFTFFYAVQARPFAATAFFVAVSTWALLRAVVAGDWRWWALYAVACAAAAYGHYTCIFVLGVQGAWSLWICRDRLRGPVYSALAATLLYVPWLPHVQGRGIGAFAGLYPLTAKHVEDDLIRLVAGDPLAPIAAIPTHLGIVIIAVCAIAGIGALMVGAKRRHNDPGWGLPPRIGLLFGLAIASPVGIVLYSVLATDLWSTTAIYASVPAATLVLATVLVAIPRPANFLALIAVAAVLAFALARAASPGWQRPPYRAVAAYLDRSVAPREPVLMALFFGNPDLQILLHRPLHLVNGPRIWTSVPPGGRIVVVDTLAVPQPPSGFQLLTRRVFQSHVIPTTVWTFTRVGPSTVAKAARS
jgi:mannosyltransferase